METKTPFLASSSITLSQNPQPSTPSPHCPDCTTDHPPLQPLSFTSSFSHIPPFQPRSQTSLQPPWLYLYLAVTACKWGSAAEQLGWVNLVGGLNLEDHTGMHQKHRNLARSLVVCAAHGHYHLTGIAVALSTPLNVKAWRKPSCL